MVLFRAAALLLALACAYAPAVHGSKGLSTDWTTDYNPQGGTAQDLNTPMTNRPSLATAGVPTHVYFTFQTVRLASVDVIKGTFTWDGFLYISWRDDRLRASPLSFADGASLDKTKFNDCINSCTLSSAQFWSPQPQVMNEGTGVLPVELDYTLSYETPKWVQGDEVDVDTPASTADPAWVVASVRLFVELTADFDMTHFPFDWHDVGLHLESRNTPFKDLRWVPVQLLGRSLLPPGGVAGWDVVGVGSEVSNAFYAVEDDYFSHLHVFVRLRRLPAIYNLRFTLGTALLTIMSFLALFMKAGEADRLSLAATCFLGIVSWQFILVASTPAVGYATRMDVFLVMSLVFVTGMYVWDVSHTGLFGASDEAASESEPEHSDVINDKVQAKPLNLHRKLDWSAFLLLSIGYLIASAAILVGGLKGPTVPAVKSELKAPISAGDF